MTWVVGVPASLVAMATTGPAAGSLDAVRATAEGVERFRAAVEYVERAERAAQDGRAVRDREVCRLVAERGPAATVRATGLSLATVKIIARGVARP